MARPEPQEIADLDPVSGRAFTDVSWTLDDLSHLRRIGRDLRRWVQEERPGEDRFRVTGEVDSGPWQHVVTQGERLRAGTPFVVVGFCGIQRADAPREELGQADEEMIEEFPTQPHILSYSTWAREAGRFDNLVCFQAPEGLDDWRENEVHVRWVRRLAHLSYEYIRLHRGEAPVGLRDLDQLRLLRTGYYDYGEDPPWNGVRAYPGGLTGEDASAALMKKDETRTDPPKGPRREAGGEEVPKRRTAIEETDRLTNMATAVGAGASLVPIPGTSAALSAMEILLIGAITRIWDHPLSDGFVAGLMRHFVARWGAAVGLHIAADAVGWIPGIGTLVKPAVNAGCIMFLGASIRDYMAREHGGDMPAAVTAEEAKESLERATARIAVYAPDLKEGAKKAFQGDGKKLAATLRRMFAADDEAK